MILKKPYAFLIKYFKIIHIIMFIIFSFLIFRLRDIYMFFSNYVKTNNFTFIENMENNYTSLIVILLIVIVLFLNIFIYSLMKVKEKPILFYRILFIYLVFLLIYWIYFRNFFSSLDTKTYDTLYIIIYRDITAFLYYLNYFYVGFSFIRGFGFDIKKFSFDKDKKELHLDETDNEEVEVNFNLDKDNIINYFKREKREFSYYLKENKLILTIILVIVILFLSGYIYFNYFKNNKKYNENEFVLINNVNFKVNKSLITNLDKYSNIINKNNYFVIVNIDVINNNSYDVSFNKEKFRIKLDDNYYYPVYNYNESFNDLGNNYSLDTTIKASSKKEFFLVFKIDNKNYNNGYFEILKNTSYQYESIKLSIDKDNKNKLNINMNEEININNWKFKINNYEITNKTEYKYQECDNTCNTYTKIIVPLLNDYVMIIEIDNLDNVSFFEDYLGVIYNINDKKYEVSSKDIKVLGNNDNKLYLNVPNELKNATSITLTIKTRNTIYEIKMR